MNETVAPSTSDDPAVDMANDDDHSRETMRDNNTLPTHKLEHLKVGANGVQLLVSTQNHLYDAKNVEGGDSSFQCVGSWGEGSVQELGKMVVSHRTHTDRPHNTPPATTFRGTGRTTASFTQDSGPSTTTT
ncbi:hypothetical protein CMEL01_01376 [Colletotrichum melonis]|uniref:Uncharacterized protein n=1 Tax=Colletotrichum melonis TaxID=1209925 RepID=A0AAI9V6F3_9PEZI|nr:hypothetical protein CMEL01_01376 [Colletotrichum melonis]